MNTKSMPRRIVTPFIVASGILLLLGTNTLTTSLTWTAFFWLGAALVIVDGLVFHRRNMKQYWGEILAAKGRAGPSDDREWNSWSLTGRMLHIVMFVAIAAVMVFGSTEIVLRIAVYSTSTAISRVLLLMVVNLAMPVIIWLGVNEMTLPRRAREILRDD